VKIYAQHGWGKGEKVDRGLGDRSIQGVILSPHDEEPSELRDYVRDLSRGRPRPDVLCDPQLYVSLVRNANEGKLPQYPYYRQNLSLRDFGGVRNIQGFVRANIDFQRDLPLTHILSPTIIVESFTDRSAQIAFSLAQEAIDYCASITGDSRPLLISFAFAEGALSHRDDVAEFLDTISLFEAKGFYLIVDRNDTVYSQDFHPGRLAELIRIVYSLKRSRFTVVCGYSDFLSLLFGAAGADASAMGWLQKLRRFNSSRFQPSQGGRRPRDRYSSSKLVNSIYLTELDACQDVRRLPAVKSNTPYDAVFDGRSYPSGVSWSQEESALHHWATLAALVSTVNQGSARERIDHARRLITDAQTLYDDLAQLGVRFEPPNGSAHLENWNDAIGRFLSSIRA